MKFLTNESSPGTHKSPASCAHNTNRLQHKAALNSTNYLWYWATVQLVTFIGLPYCKIQLQRWDAALLHAQFLTTTLPRQAVEGKLQLFQVLKLRPILW